ncbi:MAG TPA: hypothetical protein VFV63_16030, partial [Ilumatobacteraceae bacterium]|nr:hypothetical protein [Ilumatobacteraceae bacterium]
EERRMMRGIQDLGGQMLARIPGLEPDREILRLHNVHAVPDGPLPLESAVLRVAIAYDRLEAGGKTRHDAVEVLRSRDPMYDSEVLDVLEAYGPASLIDKLERAVSVSELASGMVLTRDITGTDGSLLLGTGHQLNDVIIERLRNLAERRIIRQMVLVAMLDDTPAAAS